jgi:Flp pilus assembly protein TadD
VHYNLGLAYAGTGRMTEAEEELRRAQALNPADADTYNVLSHVLLQQGRALEALAAAEQALGYAPRHEGAQYYRALAQERLARP